MHSIDSGYQLPPFPAFPSTDRYIPLGSIQNAVQRIDRSIQAKDAISMVIGPPGTGKTLICSILSDQYQGSHQVITLGETPIADRDSFLRRILHQLGSDLTHLPGGDVQLALFDHLSLHDQSDAGLLLLIDEAQSLNAELLETVRTLTNLTRNSEPRVTIVLAGGNQLDELLIAPAMDGFRQRISTRCYLHPLNGEETAWYINQTIRNCGCDPDATITTEAIAAVHHACSGVPRLINQLLTHAIEYAAERDQYIITDQIIEMAWAEVQQLPSPMINEPEISLDVPSIEFGELDELPDTNPTEPDASPLATESFDPKPKSDAPASAFTDPQPTLRTEPTPESSTASPFTDDLESFDFEPNPEYWPSEPLENEPPDKEPSSSEPTPTPTLELEFPELSSPALSANPDTSFDTRIDTGLDTDLHETDLNVTAEPDVDADNRFSEFSQTQAQTQSNEDLFGNFDEEETINVTNESDANAITNRIEPVLHEEIVGIIEIPLDPVASGIHFGNETPETNTAPFNATTESTESDQGELGHDETHGLDPSSDLDPSSEQNHVSAQSQGGMADSIALDNEDHALTILNANHDPTRTRSQEDVLRKDDSDLLIIEDELELRRIDKPQTSRDSAQPVSIDYQTLLSRMRSKE